MNLSRNITPALLVSFIASVSLVTLAEGAASGAITSSSLAERGDHVEGATLFSSLPAGKTGLHFENKYDDPDMWGSRYREFTLGAVGTGIAVGDYDGDGRPDIYVVSKTGPNKLFRQVGDFEFEDVTEFAGVAGGDAWGTGATFVDINNNGLLDLYVCQHRGHNLLYINQGDGTFKEMAKEYGLDVFDASVMASFADYNRNGHLDLYLVTNRLSLASPQGQPDYLFRNNGDGTFTDVSFEAGIHGIFQGHSATWWDYNLNGWPDLYVANDFGGIDRLYRNNGDGTFTNVIEEAVPHTPYFSMGSDFADINNNGLFDFLVADMAARTHYKQKVAMGDMSVFLDRISRLPFPQNMRNVLYLNTGTERFMEAAYLTGLSSTDWTWAVKFGDLDNSGWVDLFVTNGMIRNFTHADLSIEKRNARSAAEEIQLYEGSPPLKEHNLAFRNRGDLKFEDASQPWGLDHFGISFGAAFSDLNRNGNLDLVVNNYEEGITLYRNENPAGNSVLLRLAGVSSNRYGVGSVVRIETESGKQIRQLMLARGALSSDEPLVHFGLGGDERINRLTIEWPGGHKQVFESLEANRFYTITEPDGEPDADAGEPEETGPAPLFTETTSGRGLNLPHRNAAFDDFERQPLLPKKLSTLGPGVAWIDYNGNGQDDIFLAGGVGQSSRLFMNMGEGRFIGHRRSPWLTRTDSNEMAPLWFDFNGNGLLDLYLSSGGNHTGPEDPVLRDHLYLNDGNGGFEEAPDDVLPAAFDSSGVVAAADFDRDGKIDLFVGGRVLPGEYPSAPSSRLLRNTGGRFVDVTDELTPGLRDIGMVTGALWTDVEGNGWMDLLLAVEWGPVHWFRNTGEGFVRATEEAGLSRYRGWWNSITGADITGNGHIDYIVGNVGLNTKYKASDEKPALLYSGDFDGTGNPQLLEAKYEGASLFPVRGKSCSTMAMPFLADKFPTYDAFGRAELEEIYTAPKLEAADQFSANEFSTGVFINHGDGTFTFRPLPRIAQTSPAFGIVAEDFDGDGRVDVYLVQNFFGPEPETGRFDGGISLLLKGNGNGELIPVSPLESGLMVTGDARGLAVGDLDGNGWPDLALTRNNDSMLLFGNNGRSGKNSFSVALNGSSGNSRAVGARVTVILRDGTTRASEVYAGSGYLSQSSGRLFFGYEDGNDPVAIEVRWPDGNSTSHEWNGSGPRIVIDRP